MVNREFWKGKRVFLTGHSGFKGSWLSLWLEDMGAIIAGCSLMAETTPNLNTILGYNQMDEMDIRDARMPSFMKEFDPDIIIHMAAQPIVLTSYEKPMETFDINVWGTVCVLDAARKTNAKAILVVTTDKVYENKENGIPFNEGDKLGGNDPYSASKACVEIVANSYRESFHLPIATARAGNVVGGGDWSPNRIMTDIVRHKHEGTPLSIRNPAAVRPWMHVLNVLDGYLTICEYMYNPREALVHYLSYNFGPDEAHITVGDIAKYFDSSWESTQEKTDKEAQLLLLDNQRAKEWLGWKPMKVEVALKLTEEWYSAYYAGEYMRLYMRDLISKYEAGSLHG
jgi:CDP-glucose 4,6-dehydratase